MRAGDRILYRKDFVTRKAGFGTYELMSEEPITLMKIKPSSTPRPQALAFKWIGTLLALSRLAVFAGAAPALLDDYSDAKRNNYGVDRFLVDDKTAGGKSQATQKCENGILSVQGELSPGRGAPAFVSEVSLLSPDGKPKDLSSYQGVRLRVKLSKGILCVQVASSEIQNYDFHTSSPLTGKGSAFQEVRIPFKEMKRGWSEQTALNLKSITSVNLVSVGLSKDTFAYEVDEIGFY